MTNIAMYNSCIIRVYAYQAQISRLSSILTFSLCALSLLLYCMPCLSASLWQSFVCSLIYSMFNWIFVSKHANEWVWSCLYISGTQSKQKHLYKKLHCKLHINTVTTTKKIKQNDMKQKLKHWFRVAHFIIAV